MKFYSVFILVAICLVQANYSFAGGGLEKKIEKCIAHKNKFRPLVDSMLAQVIYCKDNKISNPKDHCSKIFGVVEKNVNKLAKLIDKILNEFGPMEDWNWKVEEVYKVGDKCKDYWHGAYYSLRDAQESKESSEFEKELEKAIKDVKNIQYKLDQLDDAFKAILND